ncbi:MAG: esterase/lipase family protein [Mycobacteriaceae bacterium]
MRKRHRVLRKKSVAVLVSAIAAMGMMMLSPAAANAAGTVDVILVGGATSNPVDVNNSALAANLRGKGYAVHIFGSGDIPGNNSGYNTGGTVGIAANAQALGQYLSSWLNYTNPNGTKPNMGKKVHVIGYSMGSLVMRHCIEFGACNGKVSSAVSIAGPNHGVLWGWLPVVGCLATFGNPFGDWANYPACQDMVSGSPLLNSLNAPKNGKEVGPGAERWQTLTAAADFTTVPVYSFSTPLNGANNGMVFHDHIGIWSSVDTFNQLDLPKV